MYKAISRISNVVSFPLFSVVQDQVAHKSSVHQFSIGDSKVLKKKLIFLFSGRI